MNQEQIKELENICNDLGEIQSGNPDADSIIYALWARLEAVINEIKK